MSLAKKLFRESALERLSSPEQLDRLIQVTNPRGWIALLAVWALLFMIIIWSVFGEITTKEHGQGIIVAGGGLKIVGASGTGRLLTIGVAVDEHIDIDQVIAEIDKTELNDQITEAKASLQELQSQHHQKTAFEDDEEQAQQQLAIVTRQRHEQTIEFSKKQMERLTKQRDVVSQLHKDGMMTEIDVLRIDEEIEKAKSVGEQAELLIEELTASHQVADFERKRKRLDRKFQIEELRGRIKNLKRKLARESSVRTRFAGRVIEIRVALHSTVDVGTPIILVEPDDSESPELEAILYVSAATGKNIQVGMDVSLNPSTVRQEEDGSLRGRVTYIANIPTSRQAMAAVLSDDDLVEQFTREIGLPLEMRVALIRDPKTFSGYEWTSTLGPLKKISAGTLCEGSVTVKRQSPLSLVIPFIRRKLGAG